MSKRKQQIEGLENRILLATLSIVGTSSADVIAISQTAGGDVVVTNTGPVAITVNGAALAKGATKSYAGFTDVSADGASNNDSIQANDTLTKRITLKGSAGNDALRGGRGNDQL